MLRGERALRRRSRALDEVVAKQGRDFSAGRPLESAVKHMNQPLIDITSADQAVAPLEGDSASKPDTADVLGVPLALTDYERTMDWIDATIDAERPRHAQRRRRPPRHGRPGGRADPRGRRRRSAWSSPTASRSCGRCAPSATQATRVYGPDLMAKYCERSAQTGTRMYLYGGRNQGALVELALQLRRRYPGLQIVGGYSPPFRALTDDERDWVVDDINRSKADVVWVGTGQPKQEIWMREMRPLLDAPMLIGVGAAFDFHAGLVPQAPTWMQNVGLEWVYRLSKEPRRLWRRYARYNPRFVAGLRAAVSARSRGTGR